MLGNAKNTREKLEQLNGYLFKAAKVIGDMPAEFSNAIDRVGAAFGRAQNIDALGETMAATQNDILELLEWHKPAAYRRPDYALWSAVTNLSKLLGEATDVPTKASRNQHTEKGHAMTTATAEATTAFVQTLRPGIELKTMVYVIAETNAGKRPASSSLKKLDEACEQIEANALEFPPG
jgi:hypothetical protein